MKIETRKAKWLTSALLLWLAFAPLAQAFYNPSTGRWLSRDPIGEIGGENLFVACNNSKINQIDPFGLDATGVGDLFGLLHSEADAHEGYDTIE